MTIHINKKVLNKKSQKVVLVIRNVSIKQITSFYSFKNSDLFQVSGWLKNQNH
jgi:hypothetical protein